MNALAWLLAILLCVGIGQALFTLSPILGGLWALACIVKWIKELALAAHG